MIAAVLLVGLGFAAGYLLGSARRRPFGGIRRKLRAAQWKPGEGTRR